MRALRAWFDRIDEAHAWMARYGILLLRLSLGAVFLWLGALKFFPGVSPAADLAGRTITTLTFGVLSESTAFLILAIWETLIGIGLLLGWQMRLYPVAVVGTNARSGDTDLSLSERSLFLDPSGADSGRTIHLQEYCFG